MIDVFLRTLFLLCLLLMILLVKRPKLKLGELCAVT